MTQTPESPPPDWQLPFGVDRALWQYLHSIDHAPNYDSYIADSPLVSADVALVLRFADPTRHNLIDLGCGTGRMLKVWAEAQGIATGVDLSKPMLREAKAKLALFPQITLLHANLSALDEIPSDHFDRACCLFSTLGMIRTSAAREAALNHFFRILKPGGLLMVHAHNLWSNLWHAGGRRFLRANFLGLLKGSEGACDYINSTHQGLTNLALRMYTGRGLSKALGQAGFLPKQMIPLALGGQTQAGPFKNLRAAGWFAVGEKTDSFPRYSRRFG